MKKKKIQIQRGNKDRFVIFTYQALLETIEEKRKSDNKKNILVS
jgi:hypothetical protein